MKARKFYEKTNLKRHKEAYSDKNPNEIRKIAGVEWKALDSEGRAPYMTMVEEDKLRYTMEMAAYYLYLGDGNENVEGT